MQRPIRITCMAIFGLTLAISLSALMRLTPAVKADSGTARPPVVLLVLDEFPTTALINKQGEISKSRFPNFARLSREATWYPNHTTVSDKTFAAVPAMLSGMNPPASDTLPDASLYPQNLFRWMNDAGYRVTAEETATQICPQEICPLPAADRLSAASYSNPVNPPAFLNAKVRQNPGRSRGLALSRIKEMKISPGELTFRHLLVPHHPYQFLPTGQIYPNGPIPSSLDGGRAPGGNVRLGYQQMMLQVGYADQIIGALRRAAVKQGQWESMMLVVVADHGVEHRPDSSSRLIDRKNVGSIAFAPLFIKYPGSVRGGKSGLATQGIDVAPTVAYETGVPIPETDGRPIPELDPEPRPVRIGARYFSYRKALALRDQAIAFRDRLIGGGDLYRLGPSSGIIGRGAGSIKARPLRAGLDSPASYRSMKPRAAKVQAMITGTVSGLRSGQIVAVSVNGVIRGTAQVFRDGKVIRFGTVVDPKVFRKLNRIKVYRLRSGGRKG